MRRERDEGEGAADVISFKSSGTPSPSATLLVESWRPVNPNQRLFGLGFWHDLVWFIYEAVLQVLVLTIYVGALTSLYHEYFDYLTIKSAAHWPFAIRLVLGLVVTDFRYHVLEYVVRNTVLTIPFLILSFETPTVIWIAFFVKWYGRFYHGNIRTNFGPLRYVLVTPQSHRVHHSKEARHCDMNYASIFSFWDFAFGTQYKG